MRLTTYRAITLLVALVVVDAGAVASHATETDLTGTWLFETYCGSSGDPPSQATFDILENPLDGTFSATPVGCGVAANQQVPSSCSFIPTPPFSGLVAGASFQLPQSGSVHQTLTYSPPLPAGFCAGGVASNSSDGGWTGTIGDDLAVTGVVDIDQVTLFNPQATSCFHVANTTCPLVMRKVDPDHPGCFIDHVRSSTEECDDGDLIDGDGCDQNCTLTRCGNGVASPQSGEECDGADASACSNGCSPNCRCVACGNGWLDPGEECDDGGTATGDGCDATCHNEVVDVAGSWQATVDCGGGPIGTTLYSIAGAGDDLQLSLVCDGGASLWDGAIREWQSCGTTPSPVGASAIGTTFALDASSFIQSVTFKSPWQGSTCAPTLLGGMDVTGTSSGTIEAALGRAKRITGTSTALSAAYRDPLGNVCASQPNLNVQCAFVMRRNDVAPGIGASVVPRDGSLVTFDEVTNTGGTVAITQLMDASGEVPANFQSNGNVAPFFEVKPSGVDFTGTIETCLPYRDADDDGFVDGAIPALAEADVKLLHLENGVFVDRTTRVDPVANFVCARTDSLSPFFLGTDAAAATAKPITGKKLQITTKPGFPVKTVFGALSKDPTLDLGAGNGSADDPKLHGGTVRIRSQAAAFDTTYALPAAGWKTVGKSGQNKGYTFASKTGPIRKVVLKPGPRGLLQVNGKGADVAVALGANPSPIDVVVTIGSRRSCSRYGGTVTFVAGKKVLAKDAAAPAGCP